MNNIVVVYKSKYGSTKKYAKWIAEKTKADLFEELEVDSKKLMEYDTIIYGGGLYAGGIAGISLITKNYKGIKDKKIIVFTVGLASTDKEEIFIPIIEKNFSKEMIENINFFHFRGGIDYKKLGIIHKLMMAMLKIVTSKKDKNKLTDEDIEFLDTYGKNVDFTDKNTLSPLLSYLSNL
ncbi:MAG: flavodoxin [Clostridiales bacterium]|nr:flavodoxin [Clostridiales bacterium]